MGITTLKASIAGMFSDLTGIGTIDQERLDPDEVPRRTASRGKATPYWSLSLAGIQDRNLAVGSPRGVRQIRRTYQLRLEGWWGFAATDHSWEEWETLCEAVLNRLQLRQGTAPAPDQVLEMRNLRATPVDIVTLAKSGAGSTSRAHHVLITADVDCQLTLTAS